MAIFLNNYINSIQLPIPVLEELESILKFLWKNRDVIVAEIIWGWGGEKDSEIVPTRHLND